MEKKADSNEDKAKLQDLPLDNSPYTQYKDLEDYKKQAYGTEGHQQPNPGRGAAGSTDAPTATRGSATNQHQLAATDAINRHGVP